MRFIFRQNCFKKCVFRIAGGSLQFDTEWFKIANFRKRNARLLAFCVFIQKRTFLAWKRGAKLTLSLTRYMLRFVAFGTLHFGRVVGLLKLLCEELFSWLKLIQNAEDNEYLARTRPMLETVLTSADITWIGAQVTLGVQQWGWLLQKPTLIPFVKWEGPLGWAEGIKASFGLKEQRLVVLGMDNTPLIPWTDSFQRRRADVHYIWEALNKVVGGINYRSLS